MSREPNLWWSYDSESGGFSALPPGPFLLPAIVIALVVACFQSFRTEKRVTARQSLGSIVDSPAYQQAKREHARLEAIFIECNRLGNEMDVYELMRYRHLQQIKWVPGIDYWDYRD